MTDCKLRGALVSAKGAARPLPEPATRPRWKTEGRRVGATLPTDTYVAFKAYVARHALTGEQAIVSAIERLLRDGYALIGVERSRTQLRVQHHLADIGADRIAADGIQLLKLERPAGPAVTE